jgi:membrane-associated phospholipid phosphatase
MRDRRWPAGPATLFAALTVLVYVVSRGMSFAVRLDESIEADLAYTGGRPLDDATHVVLVSVDLLVVLALLAIAATGLRRRFAAAATAACALLAAAAGSEVVKRSLGGLDPFGIEASREDATSSFPSGHTALAYAAAVSLVILTRPRYRLATALGGAGYAAAVGIASLSDGGHYPSDVLGAVLLVLACGAAVTAATRRRASSTPGTAVSASATATVAALMAVLLVLGYLTHLVTDREGVIGFARSHGQALGALVAIVAVSVAGLLVLATLAGAHRLSLRRVRPGRATAAEAQAGYPGEELRRSESSGR